jgi:hypothetical protein
MLVNFAEGVDFAPVRGGVLLLLRLASFAFFSPSLCPFEVPMGTVYAVIGMAIRICRSIGASVTRAGILHFDFLLYRSFAVVFEVCL